MPFGCAFEPPKLQPNSIPASWNPPVWCALDIWTNYKPQQTSIPTLNPPTNTFWMPFADFFSFDLPGTYLYTPMNQHSLLKPWDLPKKPRKKKQNIFLKSGFSKAQNNKNHQKFAKPGC